MYMRHHKLIASLPLFLLVVACSEAPKTETAVKKEAEKPPEAVSAKTAVEKMFIQARAWSPDLKLLRVGDLDMKEIKSKDGMAGAWQCTFVSESRGVAKTYTYAVMDGSGMTKGVSSTPEEPWNPGGQAKPFPIQSLKVDAADAYKTAMTRGEEYSKKHPEIPVKFLLEWTRYENPAWRVFWGESVAMSGYSIYIDSITGAPLSIQH
jgi:hypothetical protein